MNTQRIYDRQELARYEGQRLRFVGQIINVSSPSPDRKLVCLGNIKIATVNNNIPIDQADPVTVGHIWLDVSEYPDKSQMFKHVCGVAYTTTYKRRDGTWSYGIRLTEDICNTESLLCRCIEQLVHDAQNSNDSMDKIAKYIDRTIHDIMSCIYDETTVLIYKTTKDIEQLLINERGRFYRHCGVLTLNREGRRAAKRSRHRPQPKQPSLGFA